MNRFEASEVINTVKLCMILIFMAFIVWQARSYENERAARSMNSDVQSTQGDN